MCHLWCNHKLKKYLYGQYILLNNSYLLIMSNAQVHTKVDLRFKLREADWIPAEVKDKMIELVSIDFEIYFNN